MTFANWLGMFMLGIGAMVMVALVGVVIIDIVTQIKFWKSR